MKRCIALLTVILLTLSSAAAYSAAPSVSFDSAWFENDARVYQHPLCQASILLAQAAFRGSDAHPDREIRAFFSAYGFSDPVLEEFDVKTTETIGTAIAHQTLTASDGALFTLVVVAVSGGNYGPEWVSNFDVGESMEHRGFAQAAEKALQRVNAYVDERGIKNPRFWITGYSRSAAVSNILAAHLSDDGRFNARHIYCYTFATPRTVITSADTPAYDHIFNIVNFADLVPHVPLEAWGYSWYGNTLYLPSSLSQGLDYPALTNAYTHTYQDMYGDPPPYDDDDYFAMTAHQAAWGLSILVPDVQRYSAVYQPIISRAILGEELSYAEITILLMALKNAQNAAVIGSFPTPPLTASYDPENPLASLSFSAPALENHMPQIYTAWLFSLTDETALTQNELLLTK